MSEGCLEGVWKVSMRCLVTGHTKSEHVKSGQVKSETVRTGQVRIGQVRRGQVRTVQDRLSEDRLILHRSSRDSELYRLVSSSRTLQ